MNNKQHVILIGSRFLIILFLLYISFELCCESSFSVAWEGEQQADMSTAVSNSASYLHVFAHKHISLPPMSGFYCTNCRTSETPNGPIPLTPPQPRLLRDFYSLPHTVSQPGCLCKPWSSATLRDTSALLRVYTLYTSDFHLIFRRITRSDTSPPAAIREALPILSECNTYSSGLRPEFQLYFWTLATTGHISTLLLASLNGVRNVPRSHEEL